VVPGRRPDLRAAGDALTPPRRCCVIVNPASGRTRGRARLARYRRLLEEHLPEADVVATEGPGDEARLADRALDDGYEVVVAVGGDGTWGNVADRVVASGRTDVALGLLPNGTGNDFVRSLGVDPSDLEGAVRVVAEGGRRRVDVGWVETPSAPDHSPDRFRSRHFLNLVGFGFDIAVIDAAARARLLTGELLYKVTALQQLFRFPGFRAGVGTNGVAGPTESHLMLTVSNGRYFGGGFPIAPGAAADDGLLHACRIPDAAPFTRLRLFSLAGKGRHVGEEGVEVRGEPAFRLTFPEPPRFEMDGEVRRSAEAEMEVRVLPGALTVLAPAR
jgi:diacylglycerol kinase (ATP)